MTANTPLERFKQRHLRACQLKQLTILEAIHNICQRHTIPYWLDGGTLLGAVRHGGFIPWDDDIDIAMHKADLQRFVEVAQKELPKGLIVQSPLIDKHLKEPITKVRDLNSFFVEPGDDFSHNYEKGLFVDIFPFIAYPTLSRKLVKKLTLGISRSYSILHKAHHYRILLVRCKIRRLPHRLGPAMRPKPQPRHLHFQHPTQQRLRHHAPPRQHFPPNRNHFRGQTIHGPLQSRRLPARPLPQLYGYSTRRETQNPRHLCVRDTGRRGRRRGWRRGVKLS